MTSPTENNNLEMKLLDLQNQLGEEKRAHGETMQQLLSAQAEVAKAQEEITSLKAQAREAKTESARAREEFRRLRAQLDARKLAQKKAAFRRQAPPQAQNAEETFKLLHLPSVALRHAFRVMAASDLFPLSMSSQRVQNAAKSIQRVALVHVESESEGILKLYLEYLNGQKVPILSLSGDILYMSPSWYYKIGGQDVEMKFTVASDSSTTPQIDCIDTQKQSVWTGIETILAELWGPRPLSLCLTPAELETFPQTQREIALLVVPRSSHETNAKELDVFFDRQSVETKVARIGCELNNYLRADSKLLNVNEVGIWSARHFMSTHLMNFKGRHLCLYDPLIVTGEIVQFIGSWLRGKTHENLETLYLSLTDFQPDFVWNCFKEEWLTRDNEPRQYVTTAQYSIDPDGSKGYYDCSDARDLRRVTDGRLASVKCTNHRFFFFVWPQKPVMTV
ncbi:unnamed protein product [Caenorhabditis brenneri]